MIIIGVDEAGRGPLVGSVIAAAVAFPENFYLEGLTDSKKLTEKKRESFYSQIIQKCNWSVGEASSIEIDQINILQATMLAMKRAVNNLQLELSISDKDDQFKVLVDGNQCPDIGNCQAIVKGDLIEPVISAASVIAKVTRDRQMKELDLNCFSCDSGMHLMEPNFKFNCALQHSHWFILRDFCPNDIL